MELYVPDLLTDLLEYLSLSDCFILSLLNKSNSSLLYRARSIDDNSIKYKATKRLNITKFFNLIHVDIAQKYTVGSMINLTYLNFTRCETVVSLNMLTNLKTLIVGWNNNLTDDSISSLTDLQTLNLTGNEKIKNISQFLL